MPDQFETPTKKCTRSHKCLDPGCNTCVETTRDPTNISDQADQSDQPPITPPSPSTSELANLTGYAQLLDKAVKEKRTHQATKLVEIINARPNQNTVQDFNMQEVSGLATAMEKALTFLEENSPKKMAQPTPSTPAPTMVPTLQIKAPRLEIPKWDGEVYEFFPWLARILKFITDINCPPPTAIQYINQAIPKEKCILLNNINDWDQYKTALLLNFGNINSCITSIHKKFSNLPKCTTKNYFTKLLSPQIKALETTVAIIAKFYPTQDIEHLIYSTTLNNIIIRKLPNQLMPFFGRKSGKHIDANGGCITPPKMFLFISKFIQTEARNFLQTPIEYFDTEPESETSIRIVQTGTKPILQTKGGYKQPQSIKETRPDRNTKP